MKDVMLMRWLRVWDGNTGTKVKGYFQILFYIFMVETPRLCQMCVLALEREERCWQNTFTCNDLHDSSSSAVTGGPEDLETSAGDEGEEGGRGAREKEGDDWTERVEQRIRWKGDHFGLTHPHASPRVSTFGCSSKNRETNQEEDLTSNPETAVTELQRELTEELLFLLEEEEEEKEPGECL